jgi:thioredoxin 1
MIEELNSDNFENFVKEGSCVIDFYADWCGPCKMLAPEIDKASKENNSVKFGKINIDNNQELSQRFQVMSIPTLIIFENNKQIERHSGFISSEDLSEKIKDSLNK